MANVHGLNDVNNQRRGAARQPLINAPDSHTLLAQQLNEGKVPFLNTFSSDRSPLDQTIPYTLKILWCPSISLISITTGLLLIIWGVYILLCTQGIDSTKGVLQIRYDVLLQYGGLNIDKVKDGQIWRVLTASFMHSDLLHITMNTLSLLFLLTRIQKIYSPLLICLLLLTSAVSGSILSLLMMDHSVVSVGSSTMIFGIFGCLIAYMVINWGYLEELRSQLCCIIGIIVFMSLLFSLQSGVDMAAHVGGLIGGFFICLGVFPSFGQKSRMLTIIGIGCIIIYLLTTYLVFFLVQ